MLKGELLKLLERFDDDQYIYVRIYRHDRDYADMLYLQGVDTGSFGRPAKPMIALLVHESNGEIGPELRNDPVSQTL